MGFLLTPLLLTTLLVAVAVFLLDALTAVVAHRTLAALLKLFLVLLGIELAVIGLLIRVLFFH